MGNAMKARNNAEDAFGRLNAELDAIQRINWLRDLNVVRRQINELYDAGALARYQWRVLTTKAKRIQDRNLGGVEQ